MAWQPSQVGQKGTGLRKQQANAHTRKCSLTRTNGRAAPLCMHIHLNCKCVCALARCLHELSYEYVGLCWSTACVNQAARIVCVLNCSLAANRPLPVGQVLEIPGLDNYNIYRLIGYI